MPQCIPRGGGGEGIAFCIAFGAPEDEASKARCFARPGTGKLNPLTVEVKSKKSLADAFALIRFKSGLR